MNEELLLFWQSVTDDGSFLLKKILESHAFLLIIAAFLFSIFFIGFLLAHNLSHLHIFLRHSSYQGFQKIAKQKNDGTYEMAYSVFLKLRQRVRRFFICMFVVLGIMVIAVFFT